MCDVHDRESFDGNIFMQGVHASMNCVIIDSGNGLSLIQCQAITCTWTSAVWIVLVNWVHKKKLQWQSNYFFIQENGLQNVLCIVMTICIQASMY